MIYWRRLTLTVVRFLPDFDTLVTFDLKNIIALTKQQTMVAKKKVAKKALKIAKVTMKHPVVKKATATVKKAATKRLKAEMKTATDKAVSSINKV